MTFPRQRWAAGRIAGVIVAGLLAWWGCSAEDAATAVSATRADLVTAAPPLSTLVPDAARVALPVPREERVGALGGTAGVEGGAATYTIPIPVPPGRRGMEPEVSLGYSSRTGNGLAGVGWSLHAGGSIYRCPQTVAQDGQSRGVDFTEEDRLCLDGMRLVLVRGRYGALDSEYRTELDRFARITLLGGSMAHGRSRFRVERKDGRIEHYGGLGGPNRRPPRPAGPGICHRAGRLAHPPAFAPVEPERAHRSEPRPLVRSV